MPSFSAPNGMPALSHGLTAFLLPLGPAMWHEFAMGLDWYAQGATIDLLLAASRITAQPGCDGATLALILAKARNAGFHRGEVPPGFDAGAAQAYISALIPRIEGSRLPRARFALPLEDRRLIHTQLGLILPLSGTRIHNPPYAFFGCRVVPHTEALLRAG